MQWTQFMSAFALLQPVAAAPGGPMPVAHQHHARAVIAAEDDNVVYITNFVTQYITMTAGDNVLPGTYWSTAGQALPTAKAPLAVKAADNVVQAPAPTTPIAAKPMPSSTLRTTTSPQPAATPAAALAPAVAPVSSSKGGKKGLAWPSANSESMAPLFSKAAGIHWYFNWNSRDSPGMTAEYLPQQWSRDNMQNVATLPKGSTLLGFNEPDLPGQALMSPAEAAASYKTSLVPLRQSGALGLLTTPAVTNAGSGLPWLKEFMGLASSGGFTDSLDVIQLHWYGPSMSLLKSQLEAVHAAFPAKKIWLTEFACTNWNAAANPSAADVKAFMGQAVPYLESLDWVEKYGWFGALMVDDESLGRQNMLVTSDGSALSDLGKYYLSL